MTGKWDKLTFKEFLQEAKKEGIDDKTLETLRVGFLEMLREDGVTDEQIYEMKMEKFPNISKVILVKFFTLLETEMMNAMGRGVSSDTINQILAPLKKQIQDWEEEDKKRG